jgi:aryl-alcohol dehydrogenase-like predicted oxidoreductase
MLDRRKFLGIAAGAGATLTLTPELLRALRQSGVNSHQQSGGKLIQRAIPSSGEMLPVIGLTFANHAGCADPAALRNVLKTFADSGGKVFDAMHVSEASTEKFHATVASELGLQNKLFWSISGLPPSGVFSALGLGGNNVKAHVETWLDRLKVRRLDSVMIHPNAEPEHYAELIELKKRGVVRYIGVKVINPARFPELEAAMRNQPIDFIGVNYSVGDRGAEKTILPLAQERKIAVIALMPFGGANGQSCTGGKGLFARVANTPLPAWAAEFDATTWAQFSLKYIVSHPAITAVRTGTTKPHHMLDNIGGGIGRLPDVAMRKRMAEFIDALPLPVPPQILDRYVGEYKATSGLIATFRRNGDALFVKVGTRPEVALVASAPIRFSDRQGSVYEFQYKDAGAPTKATGVILEQGGQKIALEKQ